MSDLIPIFLGIIFISFSGVMVPGPMFAVTLAKSYHSPFAGARISLGHAVVEVPIILLIYFGFSRFFENHTVQILLSFAGGLMIIYIGYMMYRSKETIITQGKDLSYSAFTAGIFMSGINPFFLLWWATIGSMLIMTVAPYGGMALVSFIIVHWLCDLLWLSAVSVLVYKTHRWWGKSIQLWVFVFNSIFLIGFGVYFIYSGIQLAI